MQLGVQYLISQGKLWNEIKTGARAPFLPIPAICLCNSSDRIAFYDLIMHRE